MGPVEYDCVMVKRRLADKGQWSNAVAGLAWANSRSPGPVSTSGLFTPH
jgi:hypothetical protein